jgi:hypothetical protein
MRPGEISSIRPVSSRARQVETFHGRDPELVGDQLLALFEGPVRAIRCAQAIQRDAESLGLRLRAGIHTGEIEQVGGLSADLRFTSPRESQRSLRGARSWSRRRFATSSRARGSRLPTVGHIP